METRILHYSVFSAVVLLFSLAPVTTNADLVPISECHPTFPCAGTPTEGWDGAGLGAATIDYYVGNPGQPHDGIPTSLGGSTSAALAAFDSAISAAQAIWSAVVQVTWNRVGDAINSAAPDFSLAQSVIYSAAGDHGHGSDVENAFDGAWDPSDPAWNVFAHAWGPPDISGFTGNLHLDDDELWVTSGASIGTTSATIDLVSILIHEFGHVLGLGHTTANAGDLMQPEYFGPLTTLSADDISAVRSLYACAGEGCDTNGGGDTGQVPEPGTLLLFATGLFGLAWSRRRLSA